MITVKVEADLRKVYYLDKSVLEKAGVSAREAANALARDIRSSWSPHSPSEPGSPPAVVTGELDQSIKVTSRDAQGRHTTSKNAVAAAVEVHAMHGYFLEEGTRKLEPRPFFEPAIWRLEGTFVEFFRDIFK